MKVESAFSPAGISSFFKIHDRDENGVPIKDPKHIGALGGGFVISEGVTTRVKASKSEQDSVRVFINGHLSDQALTTKAVVEKVLAVVGEHFKVDVEHEVRVPIGAGFGASGAGALSTALALSRLFELEHSLNQIGMLAHAAEIEAKTGLGTVAALMVGGCVLTVEAGGPGIASVERLLVPADVRLLAVYIRPIYTKSVLGKPELRERINTLGEDALTRIRNKPTLTEFYKHSLSFAENLGLMTDRLRRVISALQDAGAIGATQNMVGEAAHSTFDADDAEKAAERIGKLFPSYKVFTFDIDPAGARLLGRSQRQS